MSEIISRNFKSWLRGLFGAFIGAGSNAVTNMVVDPTDYNIQSTEGLHKLGWTMLVSGIIGAALYLKQHPMYDDDKE